MSNGLSQHSLDGLLRDFESRQLLVESIALFGTAQPDPALRARQWIPES